ncbi:chemotaxis protein CheW [Helicobacter mustelae]|uniref:chemotaxis protein CheW n=1 Tax=Helicobacter mustelae TaxID=217 RepID=UPI0035A6AA02
MMSNLVQVDQVTSLHKNNELQLLCFRLEKDKDLYAVNVFKIREVVKYNGSLNTISFEEHALVEGLITIRGMTLPLVDMRKWFHYDGNFPNRSLKDHRIHREGGQDDVIMICEFSHWTIGVRIFEADRILSKKWTEIEQGVSITGGAYNNKLVSYTRYFDGSLVQVVDIEKMLVDVFPWIEEEKQLELNELKKIPTKKIALLADDSPSVLKTMGFILDKLELKHLDFTNGEKLLDYLFDKKTKLDEIGFIITDLEMPQVSGFEVIKQVKNNPDTAHLPVIVNSSMSGSSNEYMALSLKADRFISKSNPIEIKEAIQELLNK